MHAGSNVTVTAVATHVMTVVNIILQAADAWGI
jgi:hypothetical protein